MYNQEMTFDQWVDAYRPAKNNIVEHAGFDGTMFETYGDEVETVRQARDRNLAWTLCDEDGSMYIVSGYWNINRLGYFITELPYDGERGDIIVNLD
jgi:hypothetical protein